MARRPRLLTAEERTLWRSAMRGVQPLPGRLVPEAPATPDPVEPKGVQPDIAASAKAKAPISRPVPPAVPPPLEPGAMAGIDRRTADRIRRGKLPLEGQIDLHGLRQAEAHRVLCGFLERCQREGKRAVLVITGKGMRNETGGVLKANVPRWLNEPRLRPLVLSFHPARQQHGGEGALYILLRRRR